jgi:hypothetical protein
LSGQPESALSAGESGGDVEQAVVQRLRLCPGQIAMQEQVLGQAMGSTASMSTASQAVLIANCCVGK